MAHQLHIWLMFYPWILWCLTSLTNGMSSTALSNNICQFLDQSCYQWHVCHFLNQWIPYSMIGWRNAASLSSGRSATYLTNGLTVTSMMNDLFSISLTNNKSGAFFLLTRYLLNPRLMTCLLHAWPVIYMSATSLTNMYLRYFWNFCGNKYHLNQYFLNSRPWHRLALKTEYFFF